jgi:hypothetical protein
MTIKKQILISVLIFVATAIILVGFYFLMNRNSLQKPTDMETFTKCLSDNGAKFYGAFWCPHCQNQKKMFGDSIKNVNYIECATSDGNGQTDICKEAGITGYPTWKFQNGKEASGELTFQQLSEYSGCVLK